MKNQLAIFGVALILFLSSFSQAESQTLAPHLRILTIYMLNDYTNFDQGARANGFEFDGKKTVGQTTTYTYVVHTTSGDEYLKYRVPKNPKETSIEFTTSNEDLLNHYQPQIGNNDLKTKVCAIGAGDDEVKKCYYGYSREFEVSYNVEISDKLLTTGKTKKHEYSIKLSRINI